MSNFLASCPFSWRHDAPSLVLAGLLALCTAAPAVAADAPLLSTQEIEASTASAVQQVLDRQRRLPGQGKHVVVDVRLDQRGERLNINLSAEYLPREYGAAFEDALHELTTAALNIVQDRSRVRTVRHLIGGKEVLDHFPEEKARASKGSMSRPQPQAGLVMVSAGHGIYYHHGYKDWRTQRDSYNGIIEDLLTPTLGNGLAGWLGARSEAIVVQPRSSSSALHVPSGKPWWQMAARYHLQEILPDNPEIWNTEAGSNHPLRERNEDITSRPLYANALGVGTLLHVHTDGSGGTGTRTYFHSGRKADQKLAKNILCYMGELIHAKDAYESWTVQEAPIGVTSKGENRRAAMPSVIVEVGFHDNASDAVALQDPVFQTAAMKGVEKGYRLRQEGKDCELFKIKRIKDSVGLQNVPVPVRVEYKGHPQFPVTAKVEIIGCPADWSCTGGTVTYTEKQPSPLKYKFTCYVSEPVPPLIVGLRTTLKDVDEVETKSVDHTVTCNPAAGQAGGAARGNGKPTLTITQD